MELLEFLVTYNLYFCELSKVFNRLNFYDIYAIVLGLKPITLIIGIKQV